MKIHKETVILNLLIALTAPILKVARADRPSGDGESYQRWNRPEGHLRYRHCVNYSIQNFLYKEVYSYIGSCEPSGELELGRTTQIYPAMGNAELEVDYWRGAFSRTGVAENFYRTDTYNCDGSFLSNSYSSDGRHEEAFSFPVENPNLSPDVKASFVANAPMTPTEAKVALSIAQKECETARPTYLR